MITSGQFKPLTCNYFLNSSSISRYSLGQKRALAVKLGYCLMDFFDANLDSKKIHFLGSYGSQVNGERLYLSFSSKLPSLPEFRIFKMGHPVLLAFAKTLLELDDGERLPINIIPRYDDQNTKIWAKFFEYVQLKESERNDSYLEALLGCLNVHSQLLRVDASVPESDILIREELYRHIVQKLEFSLQECACTLRTSTKRERSESPVAANNRACPEDAFGRSRTSQVTLLGSTSRAVMEPLQKRTRRSKMMDSEMHSAELPQRYNSRPRAVQHKTQRSASNVTKGESEPPSQFCNEQGVERTAIQADPPSDRDSFEIAIVCALPLEYNAILLLIDRFWDESGDPYGKARGDNNMYRTGRMGKFDVVLLLLPEMGKASAASAAAGLRSSYPGLRLVLLSGICGGVPSRHIKHKKHDEILLGDVIISKAVVQYDLGRRFPDCFETKDDLETVLGRPAKHIRNMLALLEAKSVCRELERRSASFLEKIQLHAQDYEYPGAANDRLFQASYRHKHHRQGQCLCCANCHDSIDVVCESSRSLSCDELGCEDKYLVKRDRLEQNRQLEKAGRLKEAQALSIFVGRVGSGDTVLKSSEGRDTIAKQHGILSLEMEGSGIWDELPCIVVKGVCDYADSHKNKKWQDFAAATAASVVKALLERYIKTDSALNTH